MVKKTLSIIIDSEIEDIVRSANHEGIIDCKKVIVNIVNPVKCITWNVKVVK